MYAIRSYYVTKDKLKKLKMDRLSFYLTINNLYVWTKYSGVDPEIGYGSFGVSSDASKTPRSRDCTLGVSVTF